MGELDRCGECGSEDVVVVVCDHVLDGDTAIVRTLTASPQEAVRHDCGDPECGETALCGDCWSNL